MIFNPYFLLFILFVIYIFKNRSDIYKDILDKEDFYSKNHLSESNFTNKYISVYDKQLYTESVDKYPKLNELVSSYKYSLNFKFAHELSKVFRIKNVESKGLYQNLLENGIKNTKNTKKLILCSESNYIDLLNNKKIDKTIYNYVCALYKTHFLIICRVELKIFNWNDILEYNLVRSTLKKKKIRDNLPNKLRIGIPDKDSDSYYDAIKIFKCVGIDITKKNDNITIVIDTEKNLFNRMKKNIDSKDTVDLIFITSSYKNHYLEDFLNTKSISVFGTEGIKDSLIKAEFKDSAYPGRIDNGKYTSLIKQGNIYDNPDKIQDTLKMAISDKETKIIGTKFHKTYSSRVIILAHKDLDKNYVKYLLRNIYGSIDKLRNRLNNYLLNNERINILEEVLDPHHMFYMNENMIYHPGAYDFYKEVHFISDEDNLEDNIYYRTNQTNLFSKLFIN